MQDGFGRQVDYLRVSITDRCNERCGYCMPEDHHDWLPKGQILSYEEIISVVKTAVSVGFRRFRITGGEPLVRRDVLPFVQRLCALQGVESVSMTTNATLLAPVADDLRRAGVSSLNISLDALDEDLYHQLTHGRLPDALAGIDAARRAGFPSIKLNTVLIKNANEGQLWPIVNFAAERGLVPRFIELMPLSSLEMIGPDRFFSAQQARDILQRNDQLEPLPDAKLGHGPARYYRLKKLGITVGFISAMTDEHFCETCNKMRLTADGFVRPCLGNHGELDLKPALRHASPPRTVRDVFEEALRDKPRDHVFGTTYTPLRIMTAIGG
ncbi:MAG: GTP 3',8-cyclase MoaA [Phycisphaeraceae bacterium]